MYVLKGLTYLHQVLPPSLARLLYEERVMISRRQAS